MNNKKVLVFGVFDGCHEGHKYFLETAKNLGNELIVVIARDEIVLKMKNRVPKFSINKRISDIENLSIADVITPGDTEINSWEVLKKYQPNIIAVGHDQIKLQEALKKIQHQFPFIEGIIEIDTHHREKYSSTQLLHT